MKGHILLINSDNKYLCKEKPMDFSSELQDALIMSYAKAMSIKKKNLYLNLKMKEI